MGLLLLVVSYFALLFVVAHRASRGAGNAGFFVGKRQSPWPVVAFGMVGTSLSGVTFISVPGAVGVSGWAYFQIALGQFIGYFVIAFVLLPAYHALRLSSIYELLGARLGPQAQKLGSIFFLLSRTLGATARLYLVIQVLHTLLLEPLGVPFLFSAAAVLGMVLLYTIEGGVKALVWTDTLQTAGMLTGLVTCVVLLWQPDALTLLDNSGLSRIWVLDPLSRDYFAKALLAGMFISIALTGVDQEMMQKSLSVSRLADAQKNFVLLACLMVVVNLAFLLLGGLLSLYAQQHGIAARGDLLFPAVVMGYLPAWVQAVFVIALVSALLPSADGAITALTSSTCLDLLHLPRSGRSEAEQAAVRRRVHLAFAALFLVLVMGFKWVGSSSMVLLILKLAGYTYGPLLGLFAYALLRRPAVRGWQLWGVTLGSPAVCAVIDWMQPYAGYHIGLELLVINGLLTFAGLWLCAPRRSAAPQVPAV